jgi:hypothetical protein
VDALTRRYGIVGADRFPGPEREVRVGPPQCVDIMLRMNMERPDSTGDERDELTVLAMLELLQQLENPFKRLARVIP